jgi:prepilin-type N-terminal cleavage/methylation domain-containing protein
VSTSRPQTLSDRRGFTLVELLIAVAILGILFSVLITVFTSATRGYRAVDATADLQQRAEVATRLLSYEVGLAGYRGVTGNLATRTFSGPQVDVNVARNEVTTAYYEDRYSGANPVLRTVTYSIGTGDGRSALLRAEGVGGTPYAALYGVTEMTVTPLNSEGEPAVGPDPVVALGFLITLARSGGGDPYRTTFAVGFNNIDLDDALQASIPR